MRISDWSSDVCSSDLSVGAPSTWALDPSRSFDGAMSRGGARTAAAMGTFEDARRMARRRVPRAVFDYVDGGADAELTMQANRSSLEAVGFVPRVGVATEIGRASCRERVGQYG